MARNIIEFRNRRGFAGIDKMEEGDIGFDAYDFEIVSLILR